MKRTSTLALVLTIAALSGFVGYSFASSFSTTTQTFTTTRTQLVTSTFTAQPVTSTALTVVTVTNTSTLYSTNTTVTSNVSSTITTTTTPTVTVTSTSTVTVSTTTTIALAIGSSLAINGKVFRVVGAEYSPPRNLTECFIASGDPYVYHQTYLDLNNTAPQSLSSTTFTLSENTNTQYCILSVI